MRAAAAAAEAVATAPDDEAADAHAAAQLARCRAVAHLQRALEAGRLFAVAHFELGLTPEAAEADAAEAAAAAATAAPPHRAHDSLGVGVTPNTPAFGGGGAAPRGSEPRVGGGKQQQQDGSPHAVTAGLAVVGTPAEPTHRAPAAAAAAAPTPSARLGGAHSGKPQLLGVGRRMGPLPPALEARARAAAIALPPPQPQPTPPDAPAAAARSDDADDSDGASDDDADHGPAQIPRGLLVRTVLGARGFGVVVSATEQRDTPLVYASPGFLVRRAARVGRSGGPRLPPRLARRPSPLPPARPAPSLCSSLHA